MRNIEPKLLQSAFRDIDHEVQMFVQTTILLSLKNFQHGTIHDALLESWTIHFRNLMFFLRNKPKDDDIFADDFLKQEEFSWKKNKPNFPKILSENYDKVNKMTTHLTYERSKIISEGRQGWEYGKIYIELSKIYNKYVEAFNNYNIFEKGCRANKIPENLDELTIYYNEIIATTES